MRTAIWASNPVAFTVHDPRIQTVPFSGCWIWMSAVQNRHAPDSRARGTVLRNAVQMPAYRAFYEKRHGSVAGLSLHHTCHTPLCCNPDHLEPMTKEQHALHHFEETGVYRIASAHRAKMTCPNCGSGYTFDGRSRQCVPCRNERQRIRWQEMPEQQKAKYRAYKAAWKRAKAAQKETTA